MAGVTRGGDGELHLVRRSGIESTVDLGSPCDEGGHLGVIRPPETWVQTASTSSAATTAHNATYQP